MKYKRPPGKKEEKRKAAAALAIFFVLIGCMVFYTRSNQGGYNGQKSMIDWNYMPRRVNESLGRPAIVEITVEKGATIKWEEQANEDILGYNLYRYKSADDPGEKVNAAFILDTVYFDDDGALFNSYAVVAVDTSGVEGPLSDRIAAVEKPVTISGLTPSQSSEVMEDVTFVASASSPDGSPGSAAAGSSSPESPSASASSSSSASSSGDSPNTSNPKPAVSNTPVPSDVVDCTAAGMSYRGTWYLEHYPEVYGGTLMVTNYEGDSLSYSFQGTGFDVISVKHWNYGVMDVYVDGVYKGSTDLFSDQVQVKATVFSAGDLEPGAHTLKLVCSGNKNPAASFAFIAVDGIRVK